MRLRSAPTESGTSSCSWADGNMLAAGKALLRRPTALGIRPVTFQVLPHPEHDPGVFLRGPEFLRPFRRRFRRALLLLDRKGSGRETTPVGRMQEDLERRLKAVWGESDGAAIVLDPELEVWLWSDSPQVDAVLGWTGRSPALRPWLTDRGLLVEGETKPRRPKEAVEDALRLARKPRSSALYEQLASTVSLRRCRDPGFRLFRSVLRGWFPLPDGAGAG